MNPGAGGDMDVEAGNTLEAVRAGALTTVQDLGRRGYAHMAVPRSGAVDVPAMTRANRLVGNPSGAAVLETTIDGTSVRFTRPCHVAVTGAEAQVRVGGRPAERGVPLPVAPGEIVEVGRARRGVRSYLAVSGGVTVEPVMGSRSTDILSGIGPAVLRTGHVLPVGPPIGVPVPDGRTGDDLPGAGAELVLDCFLGPRDDYLVDSAIGILADAVWTVNPQSNRIAMRLDGPVLRWRGTEELLSEGVVLGAIQVPPDGQPVLFLADHPATGGYPVVGVVPAPDIWRCGQARPGARVRLRVRRSADLSPSAA